MYIPFDYSEVPNAERLDAEARRDLTAWEKELATRLCETVFSSSCLFISTGQTDCLTLFVWHQGKEWESRMALFSSKFSSASRNITQALPSILVTGCFYGKEQLSACRNEYFSLIQYFTWMSSLLPGIYPENRPCLNRWGSPASVPSWKTS